MCLKTSAGTSTRTPISTRFLRVGTLNLSQTSDIHFDPERPAAKTRSLQVKILPSFVFTVYNSFS